MLVTITVIAGVAAVILMFAYEGLAAGVVLLLLLVITVAAHLLIDRFFHRGTRNGNAEGQVERQDPDQRTEDRGC